MEPFRTPTVTCTVTLRYATGRIESGQMFLVPRSRYGRPTRPEEQLNEASAFFPFLPAGAEHAVLVNKSHLVSLHVAHEEYARFAEMTAPETRRHLVLECGDVRYDGALSIDMPNGRGRTLDYLNGSDRFVAMRTADGWQLLRKDAITRVSDSAEGTLRPLPMPTP